jgi:hypothetical protein
VRVRACVCERESHGGCGCEREIERESVYESETECMF